VLLLNESDGSAVLRAGFDAAFAEAIHSKADGLELYGKASIRNDSPEPNRRACSRITSRRNTVAGRST
jgi:hypothetical protein